MMPEQQASVRGLVNHGVFCLFYRSNGNPWNAVSRGEEGSDLHCGFYGD